MINGGGAVALLALLPSFWGSPEHIGLARAILAGVFVLMLGLAAAITHNHLRRRCSLAYEANQMNPPRGKLLGITLPSPTVCFFNWLCMWISLGAFIAAGTLVAVAGLATI